MRLYILILFPFILLFSCQKEVQEELSNSTDLSQRLQKAEDLRFSHPEIVDTMLHNIYEDLKGSTSKEFWAKYYFVKAHVEMEKYNFPKSILLLDSAISTDRAGMDAYKDKFNLAYILIYESSQLYKQSLEHHEKIDIEQSTLTNNEKLTVLLSKARLLFHYKKNTKEAICQADELVKTCEDIDWGLYYSNKAYFSDSTEEVAELEKKAIAYYRSKMSHLKEFKALCLLAITYMSIDIDSSLVFLEKADRLKIKRKLCDIIDHNEKGAFYNQVLAEVLQRKGLYKSSNDVITDGIYQSRELHFEDRLFFLYKLKSKNHFELKEYKISNDCLHKALKHRLAYSARITTNQIHVNNAREKLHKLQEEHKMCAVIHKNERLKKRLFFLYSLLSSLLLMILFYNRRRINDLLKGTLEKLHQRNISVLHYQNKVESIDKHANDSIFFDKTKLSMIREEIDTGLEISSWEILNEMYQQKFPQGEKIIRKNFPNLKNKDYQHLMCIHWGFTNEKIARIFRIKTDSVRKRSNRIKKALGIPTSKDLKEILNTSFK